MHDKSSESGFSLIEISAILLIVGMIMVPLMMSYNVEMQRKAYQSNLSRFSEITDTVNYYTVHNGRYPRPASLLAASTSAAYGTEVSAVGIPSCSAWPTANGVCRTGGVNSILIGAVPFRALGSDSDFSVDYWDNKVLYAVTEAQTVTYAAGAGKITARAYDAAGAVIDLSNDNDMVLVSHGASARGAYNRNGVPMAGCLALSTDKENCNFDDIFFLRVNSTIFPEAGSASMIPGAGFYDDIIEVQRSVPADLWLQNLIDPDYVLTFATRMGVGIEDPKKKVHVNGDVRAEQKIQTDSLCALGAVGCFDPEIIGGDVPQMDCDSTTSQPRPIIRIGGSQVHCAVAVNSSGYPLAGGEVYVFPPTFGRVDCAASNQLMTGIDGSGNPICGTP